jgi:hypothetical protein
MKKVYYNKYQWNPEDHDIIFANLYSNKLDNSEEMYKFIYEFNLPK